MNFSSLQLSAFVVKRKLKFGNFHDAAEVDYTIAAFSFFHFSFAGLSFCIEPASIHQLGADAAGIFYPSCHCLSIQ
jgi:hypothetical protein